MIWVSDDDSLHPVNNSRTATIKQCVLTQLLQPSIRFTFYVFFTSFCFFVVRTEFQLNEHVTKQSLLNALENFEYKGGNTATGRALDYIREYLFSPSAGARNGKKAGLRRSLNMLPIYRGVVL